MTRPAPTDIMSSGGNVSGDTARRIVLFGIGSPIVVEYVETCRRLGWSIIAAVKNRDGEAYFDVHHENNRPFTVETSGANVRVLGTAFDVKATSSLVRVVVTRGVVEVVEPARAQTLFLARARHRLEAGQEVVVTREPAAPITATPVSMPAASWRDGFLTYDSATLGEVIADANRYAAHPIRFSDPALAQLRVTASYPTDRLDQLLASLDQGLPIQISHDANGDVVIGRESQTRP